MVSSLFYRVYAGIRAGQILSWLAGSASFMQCGFLKGKQAADIWYFVGICVEVSLQTQTSVHGCVADVIKAYNTVPRRPVFIALQLMGVPGWFLDVWSRCLERFTRYSVVRKSCTPPLQGVTGFAEGCLLSCVAMCVVCHLWHRWQISPVPRTLPLSYVDNLELLSTNLSDMLRDVDALRAFCFCLDISIGESCLYMLGRFVLQDAMSLRLGDFRLIGEPDWLYCPIAKQSAHQSHWRDLALVSVFEIVLTACQSKNDEHHSSFCCHVVSTVVRQSS